MQGAVGLARGELSSDALGNTRPVWLQRPLAPVERAVGVLVVLDAEYYLPDLEMPSVLRELEGAGDVPPLVAAYVSALERPERWRASMCHAPTADFVALELLPWVRARTGVTRTAGDGVVGLSITGLAAAHAALLRPDALPRALCQSGSFWWERFRFGDCVARVGPASSPARFWLSVGDGETATDVDHGHGLRQELSQIEGVVRARAALRAAGHVVGDGAFPGGHAIAGWRADLPVGLRWLYA